jgi:hypothetical protein
MDAPTPTIDRDALLALRDRVRPIVLTGTLTLEQASSAMRLNQAVAQFYRAVATAERLLALAGRLDPGFERELLDRAAHLAALRDHVEGLGSSRRREAGAFDGACAR